MDSGENAAADFAQVLQSVLLRASDGSKLPDGPAAIGGKILGLYFSAHWCGPCRGFTPQLVAFYNNLRKTRQDFEIIFVSSDKSEEEFKHYASEMPWLCLDYARRDLKGALGEAFRVAGIPTLVWLDRDGTVRDSVVLHFVHAADRVPQPITLEGRKKVMEDPTGAAFPWNAKAGAATAPGTFADLAGNIDKQKLYATNADTSTPVSSVFQAQPGLVRSDTDEQLLISIPFNQAAKIASIRILGPKGGRAPKNVKLFVNSLNMGFDDAESVKPTQSIKLTEAQATDASAAPVATNFVSFQRVSNLTIFIENNQGDDEVTEVTHVAITGSLAH